MAELIEFMYQLSTNDYVGTTPNNSWHSSIEYAEILHQSIKSKEFNKVVGLTTTHQNSTRLGIKRSYLTLYGQNIEKDLQDAWSGETGLLLSAMYKDPVMFDVQALKSALDGVEQKEMVLIEILLSRSNKQIDKIKELFEENYGEIIEESFISSDNDGNLQIFLQTLCKTKRNEDASTNLNEAKISAKEIFQSINKNSDLSKVFDIFCRSNLRQFRLIIDQFFCISGSDLRKKINETLSKALSSGLELVIEFSLNPPLYFAQQINESLFGPLLNINKLQRIIVSRAEKELDLTKTFYESNYHQTLKDDLSNAKLGDLGKILVSIVDPLTEF